MFYGASRYGEQSGADLSSREIEAMAFRYVNERLARARSAGERREALFLNYRLWSILLQAAGSSSNPLPDVLRKDIVSLSTWVLNQTNAAMNSRVPLDNLASINSDMLEGLTVSVSKSQAA